MKMFFIIFAFIVRINVILAIYYTEENSTNVFEIYKEKYNKVYKTKQEENIRLKTFVKNLNAVEKLNEETTDKNIFFILNQYADLDPKEIQQLYAISVKPYYNVSNTQDAIYVGRQKENELNTADLYNLDNATELFKDFMKMYGRNYTKKLDQTIHFYRFVKSLVEINKNRFEGNGNVTLDDTADVLRHPNEYFY